MNTVDKTTGDGIKTEVSKNLFSKEELKKLNPEIKRLSKLRPVNMFALIAMNWLIIITCLISATIFPDWWVFGLCFFIIPTRQHSLFVIVHDAAHFRITNSKKWNDLICNVFFTLNKRNHTSLIICLVRFDEFFQKSFLIHRK